MRLVIEIEGATFDPEEVMALVDRWAAPRQLSTWTKVDWEEEDSDPEHGGRTRRVADPCSERLDGCHTPMLR